MNKLQNFLYKITPWHYVSYDKAIIRLCEETGLPDNKSKYLSEESNDMNAEKRTRFGAYCLLHYLKGFNLSIYGSKLPSTKLVPVRAYHLHKFDKTYTNIIMDNTHSILGINGWDVTKYEDICISNLQVRSKDLNKIIKHINKTMWYAENPRPY